MEELVSAFSTVLDSHEQRVRSSVVGSSLRREYSSDVCTYILKTFERLSHTLVAPLLVVRQEKEFVGQFCGIVAEDECGAVYC